MGISPGGAKAAPLAKLNPYSMSLPVAGVVPGMPKLEHMDENITIAKSFPPLGKPEMKDLSDQLSKQDQASLDRFFTPHVDA